jgi:hypothetical protein
MTQHPAPIAPRAKFGVGECKLTGTIGPFVRSHLLPLALTRHEVPGEPIYQAGEGSRPIKRMTSWYDTTIVTADGESILSGYDDWAILALRRLKLVWSGWKGARLKASDMMVINDEFAFRKMENEDWARLRLFFLSLLWRAAESSLREFSQIVLPQKDLELIRKALLSGIPPPLEFYPIMLTQLSTKGPPHNHAPIPQLKTIPSTGPVLECQVRLFRFYIDGLIIHFHRDAPSKGELAAMGPLVLESGSTMAVQARSYEGSFQAENLAVTMAETWEQWPAFRPQILKAIYGRPDKDTDR